MSRRPVPDPTAVVAVVAGRVDGIEQGQDELRRDVTALGRGLADVIAHLRRLTHDQPGAVPPGSLPAGTRTPPSSDGDGEGGDDDEAQVDWFTITDPGTAQDLLTAADQWAGGVLAWHGLDLAGVQCWPLHPCVVIDVLALSAAREHAYPQADPTPVIEWLTRWLPNGIDRIRAALTPCLQDHAHAEAGALFDATGLTTPQGLAAAATWWACHRDTPAPVWLDLPRIR